MCLCCEGTSGKNLSRESTIWKCLHLLLVRLNQCLRYMQKEYLLRWAFISSHDVHFKKSFLFFNNPQTWCWLAYTFCFSFRRRQHFPQTGVWVTVRFYRKVTTVSGQCRYCCSCGLNKGGFEEVEGGEIRHVTHERLHGETNFSLNSP